MFDTILDSFKSMFISLGEMVFGIFTKVGAVGFIVGIAIIGLFVSFVVLNRVGLLSRAGRSDKVKR